MVSLHLNCLLGHRRHGRERNRGKTITQPEPSMEAPDWSEPYGTRQRHRPKYCRPLTTISYDEHPPCFITQVTNHQLGDVLPLNHTEKAVQGENPTRRSKTPIEKSYKFKPSLSQRTPTAAHSNQVGQATRTLTASTQYYTP